MIERSNTNVALEKMFEEVFDTINRAKRMPIIDCLLLKEDEIITLLDDLRDAIPREIKSANQVLEEQKSIVNKAYADADSIVQNAREEADKIINIAKAEAEAKIQQEEIVKQANAFAEEVKSNALRYQEEVKTAADDYSLRVKRDSLKYADDMLAYLCQNMQSALQNMSDNRESIGSEITRIVNGQDSILVEEKDNEEE